MGDWIITGALLALLLPAVACDLSSYRVPNRLVFPFWLLAPVLHLALGGAAGLLDSMAALGIALAVGLPFWLLGWMGAGDVKLVAAAGALVGLPLVWPMLGAVGIAGALLAMLALLFKGALGRAVERYRASFALSLAQRRAIYIEAQGADAQVRLPYAIAIATGTLGVWAYHLQSAGLLG